MSVPSGGVLDAYDPECGAVYSETPVEIGGGHSNPCDDSWRATSGTVTAESITYWPWWDQAPSHMGTVPEEGGSGGEAVLCIKTPRMANRLGAEPQGDVDEWGGLAVNFANPADLPMGWMAQFEGGSVDEFGNERTVPPGFATLYPPYTCREELGYKQ